MAQVLTAPAFVGGGGGDGGGACLAIRERTGREGGGLGMTESTTLLREEILALRAVTSLSRFLKTSTRA
jgi:hypothetical protein